MYIDAIQYNDEVVVWYRKANNKLVVENHPAPYYFYVKSDTGQHKSIFGDSLEKVEFDSKRDYYNAAEDYNDEVFESDISPVYKFLSDNYHDKNLNININVGLFDIEVDYCLETGGYPDLELANNKINALTLFDKTKNLYNIIYVSNSEVRFSQENVNIEFYHCYTERQLLEKFISLIKDIDVLCGWNSAFFDLPYIYKRLVNYFGEPSANKLLCRDDFYLTKKDVKDKFDNPKVRYELVGRVHVDLLELYQKFTQGEKPSYSLENICQDELGYGKLEYEGDLGELYRTDIERFLKYNLHDVILLNELENKKKFLQLSITMAHQASIKITDVTGTIRYLEGLIRNYTHHIREEKLVLPNKKNNDREYFSGAMVVDTKAGLYSTVCTIDITSLYPSTIRAINISPETHVFQCLGRQDDFISVVTNTEKEIELQDVKTKDVYVLYTSEVKQLLIDNGFTISANGSIFTTDFVGIIPEVLSIWFKDRQSLKNKAKKYLESGDKKKYEYYNMLQDLKKLSLNSLYGAISNPYSRFYSLDCAASVTLSGQYISKFQIIFADSYVKKSFKKMM